MAKILPFKALRPSPQYAKKVASKPYDVLNYKEAKAEAAGVPESFLHVTRSEIDLPAGTDAHAEEVYLKAKENLEAFISRNILFQESKPCYYIYELRMNDRVQAGLVCGSSLKDYENDLIKKHEFTRPDKELDRINHIKITGAQTGNVFLAYRNVAEIDEIIERWMNEKSPLYDIITEDKVQHRVWIINDDTLIDTITQLFDQKVPHTYIADGHHRAASAYKVCQPNGVTDEIFLTTLFPAGQLQILDYNRVIKDTNGYTEEALISKLLEKCMVEKVNRACKPKKSGIVGMYMGRQWYKLTLPKDAINQNDPIAALDISMLQEFILGPVFNITDQRTDPRIDFVGGIRGMEELVRMVDGGEAKVAFSIFPVTMEQLFAVSDGNQVMPPKSTWFEPKLRDGLLTNLINN